MCGITGIFDRRGLDPTAASATVREMACALHHRGPDDSGEWLDPAAGVALGFRRLAILDLSPTGKQPMTSMSGRYVMIFNGEVYNYRELRRTLEGSAAEFRGQSDTEVILASFERWGVLGALPRFVGMFAIAVWDRDTRTLHLVRDRLGIKPLFYNLEGGRVTFASELKALFRDPAWRPELDVSALASYLRFLYVPAPRTIFQNTYKLPPGHVLSIPRERSEIRRPEAYWSLSDVAREGLSGRTPGLADEEAVEALEALLADAVRLRLRSDVPLGALLSGGLDSSTVAAVMQEQASDAVHTYTIGFGGGPHDESHHAAAVARHLGTRHTELQVTGREALDVIPRLASMYDEPLADPSQIPTFLVSRLARGQVTVALSGDGGDELFGGYNRYVSGAGLIPRLSKIPWPLRSSLGRSVGLLGADQWDRLYRGAARVGLASGSGRLMGEKIAKVGQLMRERSESRMYRSLLSSWASPTRLLRVPQAESSDPFVDLLDSGDPAALLDRMMLVDQAYYLPDDLLAKVDRASMAVSLEVRVPILDHRIVEFSWRLGLRQKIRDGVTKWILRELLYRRVPRELVDRPKVGFSVPVAEWLRGPLKPWAEELLDPVATEREGLFDAHRIRSAWTGFQRGRSELALGLWAVLVFKAWKAETLG